MKRFGNIADEKKYRINMHPRKSWHGKEHKFKPNVVRADKNGCMRMWSNNDNNVKVEEMERYSFDNFIVGESNRFAYKAARAAATTPGDRAYNPLILCGNSGLGKTHLLYAAVSAFQKRYPEAKLVFIKAEDFTSQMVKAIKDGALDALRRKLRNADLLMVDDIQFIAGRDATQEQFFHTFDALIENGKQIVVASGPTIDSKRMDDRLRDRFAGGLTATIQPPELETRLEILRSKAGCRGLVLSDDAIGIIAQRITASVRQLEGVINYLAAAQQINHTPDITQELVEQAVSMYR